MKRILEMGLFGQWYHRLPFYALSFLVVSSLAGVVTYFVMGMFIRVEVPDLKERSLPEAVEILDNAGLSVKVEAEAHDLHVPAGHIMEQHTPPGTLVRGHSEVAVVLSKGPEVRTIPSVVGLNVEKAGKMFLADGLDIVRFVRVHSETVKKDIVIAQRPAAEEWTGEVITLVVSAGPRDVFYYCPSFKGMRREDAFLLSNELALKAVVSVAGGDRMVIGQHPEPGSVVKPGSTLSLTLGGGWENG